MTKPQHTPAPWKVLLPDEGLEKYQLRVHSILHGARSGVASVLHPQGDGTEDGFLETRANAALIAAAPYLLDALQFVMTATGEQLTTAFEQAQDAIDLALGEAALRAIGGRNE